MTACPKCGAAVADGAADCARCGVVFDKFERRIEAASPGYVPPVAVVPPAAFQPPLDTPDEPVSAVVWWARAILLLILVWLTWRFARVPLARGGMIAFLDLPNLVFHEAGHVVFSPFGRFMTVLGGSLFQILIPLIIAGAFVRERQLFNACLCTWWAGQNMLDVAVYMADARSLSLVLLGGKTGAEVEGHDWEYLLTTLGVIHRDRAIGLWTHYLGVLVMVASIAFSASILLKDRERKPREP
jgi:hypothetical protein